MSQTHIDRIKEIAIDTANKILTALSDSDMRKKSILLIFSLLLFLICIWIYNKMTLNTANCVTISKLYHGSTSIKSVVETTDVYKHSLRDCYVKTAYNACSGGQYKNDFVNLCALENVIKQGARCIDLEIYSLDNEPVVATSSTNNYSIKETYNSIKFGDVLTTISNNAFSGSTCPNQGDPIILHLRIMSNNKDIYEKIAALIEKILQGLLMGPTYSYENNGRNFGEVLIADIMGKVVIIVDKSNPLFESSKLDEYVNLTSSSVFMRKLRHTVDVKYAHDKDELKKYNTDNMSIVMPDLSASNANYSWESAWSCGCQFTSMCFQNLDHNMKTYNKQFDGVGHAYILKPPELRNEKIVTATTETVNPNYSYQTMEVASNSGTFKI